ncbi:HNH endonuclease signature motif containing protein [Nocardioides sp.]|uniref:HNH endonuclease signature motif containing protein n=1 Tax=Nocardioides sp. TaxID=35761 RepID=UPI00260855E1|nr:HNH endonuclease signature motif containing protein [Nocardioides sp.]MCW2736158.1 endonuclease [Nocardioides sp.]
MTHPILTATSLIDEALKTVAGTNPTFMPTTDKAEALRELVRIESRVAELRMRILADAADLAADTGSRDAAGWFADATRTRFEDARADLRLATGLDRRWRTVAAALREGRVNTAQARAIVQCLDVLPDAVPQEVLDAAEAALIDHAARFSPKQLTRIGRHILTVVAPDLVDETEGRRLAALEAEARRRTRLTLRRLGNGTTRISGILPDAAATRLATYLEAHANPRRDVDPSADDSVGADALARLPYPRRLGEAFCQLLECLDPQRLPVHGGDATTMIITIPFATLTSELGAADILGAGTIPSDAHADPCAGETMTAAQARRLACTARLMPAVLGGDSEILDVGRAQRLFTAAQRRALLLRDRTCRAEGCDIPGTWAEAHHWISWLEGGPTDLDNGVLLCSHHHHRAHEPDHTVERLASGDVRFARRT